MKTTQDLQKKMNHNWILIPLLIFSETLFSQNQRFIPHSSPQDPGPALRVPLPKTRAMLPQPIVKIKGLKAVLIGAPIDGDAGMATRREIDSLKLAALELRKNNVKTFEFYSPHNQWRDIKSHARGAHFLLYRGHGVYDGERPPGWVGGFSLKKQFISSQQLRRDLKLAKGAIVMLYGCFTAGNSGFDIGKIDQVEAQRRVAMYSKPFLLSGFAGYYANWNEDAFQNYIAQLFAGKTLGQSWQAYRDFNAQTASYQNYPLLKKEVLWIDHDSGKNGIAYNNAFAGQANATLLDLFSKPSTYVKFRNWIMP